MVLQTMELAKPQVHTSLHARFWRVRRDFARDLPDDAQTDENDHFMSHATGIRNFRIRNFDWWLI